MTLVDVSAGDLDAVLALEVAGFDHGRWSAQVWRDELTGPGRRVLGYRDGAGTLAGVAAFRISDAVADLMRLVVAPDARGRGIGGALVQAGMQWTAEQGAVRMLLEVECSNTAASTLYRRFGFATIAVRRNYYGPDAHALVMERPLSVRSVAAREDVGRVLETGGPSR